MRVVELQTDNHIWAIRDLSAKHHAEFGEGRAYDSTAVVMHAMRVARRTSGCQEECWIAYTADDKPAGYLYGTIATSPYSFEKHANHIMWFVLPEFRGSRAGLMLARAYEQWAQNCGCECAYMTVDHLEHFSIRERIMRLVNRLGYNTRGTVSAKMFRRD